MFPYAAGEQMVQEHKFDIFIKNLNILYNMIFSIFQVWTYIQI